MSYRNKGSMPTTVMVSREPDRSGNFVCDGVADDVQINQAIAYVNGLGGGSVFIERGDYDIIQPIVLFSNINLFGGGSATHITCSVDNVRGIEVIGTGVTHKEYINISDLYLEGTGTGDANGIHIDYVDYMTVENVILENWSDTNWRAGINAWANTTYLHIFNCTCFSNYTGIAFNDTVNYSTIIGCTCYDNIAMGITLSSAGNITISASVTRDNGNHGIFTTGNNAKLIVDGLQSWGNVGSGLILAGHHAKVVSSQFFENEVDGIDIGAWNDIAILGCSITENRRSGIHGVSCGVCTFVGNVLARNGESTDYGGYGIWLENGSDSCVITGNNFNHQWSGSLRTATAIYIDDSHDITISGNTIWDHPVGGVNGYGLYIVDSLRTLIDGNSIVLCDTAGICEVGTTDYTYVGHNTFNTCGVNATIIGANARLLAEIFQFTEPLGTAAWQVASPTGIVVDAADEGGLALGEAPLKVQQVIRFRVKGVALGNTGAGKGMLLEININAGKPTGSEAYNAEAIAVASVISTEDNVVINDTIEWVIDASDDTDIGDINLGETMELFAMFEDTGADGDIATNAVIRTISMEYV